MPQLDILCQQVKPPVLWLHHDQRGPMDPTSTPTQISQATGCSPQPGSKALLLKTALNHVIRYRSFTLLTSVHSAEGCTLPQKKSNHHSHPALNLQHCPDCKKHWYNSGSNVMGLTKHLLQCEFKGHYLRQNPYLKLLTLPKTWHSTGHGPNLLLLSCQRNTEIKWPITVPTNQSFSQPSPKKLFPALEGNS